jgi:serine/threonine-protein kinase HipA
MAKNALINIYCFDHEIGKLGMDENKGESSFQFNPTFLENNPYPNLFPKTGVIKNTNQVQVFKNYNNDTFKGLPPIFADSLPDMFGNIIFKTWLENNHKNFKDITALEQLAYVGNRGMGAIEYHPIKKIANNYSIQIPEIVEVLKQVLDLKRNTSGNALNQEALLNIFKIGTSAGGARPKILISENKATGEIIPGDVNYSKDYNHYLVKLSVDDDLGYARECIEYAYYLSALKAGIDMMPSKLIDNKHFSTERFDRINGNKQHVLTATGLTGWDFKSTTESSYENLFELALFLKLPHSQIEDLFNRMVFNVVFANTDDHLKNHSFIYNEAKDIWNLSPAYDLTYSLNPLINYTKVSRALSINGKRTEIGLEDVLAIAKKYTVKNPKGIIEKNQDTIGYWREKMHELGIPNKITESIEKDFNLLI